MATRKKTEPMKPYNDHTNENFLLYDNMPYQWDTNCDKNLTLVSGNLIKGYHCKIDQTYKIKH